MLFVQLSLFEITPAVAFPPFTTEPVSSVVFWTIFLVIETWNCWNINILLPCKSEIPQIVNNFIVVGSGTSQFQARWHLPDNGWHETTCLSGNCVRAARRNFGLWNLKVRSAISGFICSQSGLSWNMWEQSITAAALFLCQPSEDRGVVWSWKQKGCGRHIFCCQCLLSLKIPLYSPIANITFYLAFKHSCI